MRPRTARRALIGLALALAGLQAPATRAQDAGLDPEIRALLPAPLFLCEGEVAIFESLRHGPFDYCRQHLRYVPGSFDCLRIILPTCNVFPSAQPTWVFRSPAERVLGGHAERIVCPPGPPPPTCPAGFPSGPIPRP